MDTDKIKSLCRLSDEYYNNYKSFDANKNLITEKAKALKIELPYSTTITLDLDDYPELRPVVGKIKDYVLKSENERQNEIKLAIMKILGK